MDRTEGTTINRRRFLQALGAVGVAVACGPAAPTGASGDAAACADGKTLEDGTLTIATGNPAFPPYVIDDAPESCEGF